MDFYSNPTTWGYELDTGSSDDIEAPTLLMEWDCDLQSTPLVMRTHAAPTTFIELYKIPELEKKLLSTFKQMP